jgi:murein DD-endopeptidase MepM/ murein hydrolase activator NlpD
MVTADRARGTTVKTPKSQEPIHRHYHRRQAVRRHAQRHHWHFYKNRSDWSFVQNFARAPIRWTRERGVLGAVVLVMAVLGFVVLPGWATIVRNTESSAPPAFIARDIALPPAPFRTSPTALMPKPDPELADWTSVEVQRGHTLGQIFAKLGLDARLLQRVLDGSPKARVLASIRPGDVIDFALGGPIGVTALRFTASETERVVLKITPDSVTEIVVAQPIENRVARAAGRIEHSLFAAGEASGLSDAMIMQMAEVFGYDIDFAQDLRRGDSFSVVYEEIYRDGEKLRNGTILGASFVNGGKEYTAIRFQRADGRYEYFSVDGRSLKKAFLRTPLEFTRISSRFNSARRHPILGTVRAHRGVDYAAPKGTSIRAAGAGKVAFRGWKSGYGNTIILEHAGRYTTLYGHLSRFASNLKAGGRVDQGQVIGHVGMTGLATAPHLHYEFRVGGVHRDPLSIELPKAEPLAADELVRFRAVVQPMLAQFALLKQKPEHLAAR